MVVPKNHCPKYYIPSTPKGSLWFLARNAPEPLGNFDPPSAECAGLLVVDLLTFETDQRCSSRHQNSRDKRPLSPGKDGQVHEEHGGGSREESLTLRGGRIRKLLKHLIALKQFTTFSWSPSTLTFDSDSVSSWELGDFRV